ncbi:scavenger receptor cysteine-rich domain superfamily protein-like [Mizuhopecten yessoensis]|uniref:scavenger receptor cysteine-rich domain superfamily protein-like n=1 Tax=Mizuhopecten yessoensis TaxID=6573 RepID=UPI000B458512|nr:scavenger receptor cysteine-rich domain superfamily protein-like [Mizuhopecten yessoensis]
MADTGKSVLSDRTNSPMDFGGEAPNGSGGKPGSTSADNCVNEAGVYSCKGFEDIGKCFTKLHLQITGLHEEIGSLKTTVSNLEQFADHTNDSLRTIHEKTIPNIEDKITTVDNERIKLDMWGRKWNLVVRGVKGDLRETPRNTEKAVRNFLTENLKMEDSFSKNVLLTAVHRLPGGSEGNRNIIIRLSSLLDRDDIMNATFKLTRGWSVNHSTNPPIMTGTVVLVNGSVPSEGRVEIYYNKTWGKIYANNHWNKTNAIVVCRQLNYTFGTGVIDLPFGTGSNPYLVDDVMCLGNENILAECPLTWTSPFSYSNYAAGVICSNTAFQEELSVPIRLAGGRTPSDGIVEMFYAGYWGTVAFDSNFNRYEARVICRELNFTGETVTTSRLYDNYTHIVVWKYSPSCNGNEANFSSCLSPYKLGEYGSVHRPDAAVVCDDPARSTHNDTVRLANDDPSYQGRVEILHSSFWGTVCFYKWDDLDALVVCRELGYSEGFAVFKNVFGIANSSIVTWLNNVMCNGTEQRLADCENDGWGIQTCSHSYDVGVICPGNYNGATALGTLRLMNGTSELDGRVEMNVFGEWSSVYKRKWDYKEAQVVCRQLGYTEGAPVFNAVPGSVHKYLELMECVGNELKLIDCPRTGYTNTISSATEENAGVICTGNIDLSMEDGDMRLVGGDSLSGRLEIYGPSGFGTVCDSNMNSYVARVACRQLGGYSYKTYSRYSKYNASTGIVWMRTVSCRGSELRLEYCSFSGWTYEPRCANNRELGITCQL